MRTFVFVALLALVAADDLDQTSHCMVDGAMAVSDLMDSSMFIWAAVARCGKAGMETKCEINIASAIRSVNSMINVILKAVAKCGALDTYADKCGMAASALTQTSAGLAAASGGIYQKCFDHGAAAGNFAHAEPALCVVDVKDTAKNLFKVIKSFMKLKDTCDVASDTKCINNILHIIDAFAGMGQYLAGSIGQCTSVHMKGAACDQQVTMLLQQLTKVGEAGTGLSDDCVKPGADFTRLYSQTAKVQTAAGSSANVVLAAFLPITAIAAFVGGKYHANRNQEARGFMSDHE